MDERSSLAMIEDPSLVVEEKLDGTNVGIHFLSNNRLVLQCRGHEITEGMHPQYDLFKQWVAVKQAALEGMLADRYILFGEWLYARHSVFYQALPHYFFEFDVYDKAGAVFLSWDRRMALLDGSGIVTVPVVHRGGIDREGLFHLIQASAYDSAFENPCSGEVDDLMEGIYLRTEADGRVTGRAKVVRPEFVEKIKQSSHWKNQKMVPNELAPDAEIWG